MDYHHLQGRRSLENELNSFFLDCERAKNTAVKFESDCRLYLWTFGVSKSIQLEPVFVREWTLDF